MSQPNTPHWTINLPSTDKLRLKKQEGKWYVLDMIRKKYVQLSPEEWVRQHFIHYLIDHKKYPRSLFRVEGSLQYNVLQKRADIVIQSRQGNPWMLVECKAPTKVINQETFNQIALYNMTIKSKYLVITNGLLHFCLKTSDTKNEAPKYINHLPDYDNGQSVSSDKGV